MGHKKVYDKLFLEQLPLKWFVKTIPKKVYRVSSCPIDIVYRFMGEKNKVQEKNNYLS